MASDVDERSNVRHGGTGDPADDLQPHAQAMTTTASGDVLVRHALEAEIAAAKRKHDRMPTHWEARRIEQMNEVMRLVDQLLALNAKP